MRLDDAPEHDCPDCEDHPPLVYEGSVGPAGVSGPSGRVEDGVTYHYYRCAVCGKKYRATTAKPTPAMPLHQQPSIPEKKCFSCGSVMQVKKVASGPVPSSGPRPYGGSYARAETALVWRCDKCGTTDEFKHSDVLGFN